MYKRWIELLKKLIGSDREKAVIHPLDRLNAAAKLKCEPEELTWCSFSHSWHRKY